LQKGGHSRYVQGVVVDDELFERSTSSYRYDPLYELTQVTQGASTTESYSYDPVGNRLSSSGVPTYNYNSSNELTSNSNGSYTYDANGNTLSDSSGKQYSWDFNNRLTQAIVPGVGTTTFRYDPFGRRIQKSGPLGTTNFLYDGPNLLEEVDNSGNVLARYTQDRDIDSPLSEFRGSTTSYYQADEALGSITSLSSGSGALANTYTYDSFGNLTASTGTLTNPFRYTGREFDSETGLYFYRARYFDSAAGRFISEDPIRFGGGVDFYPYVDNSPVNAVDPLGLVAGPKNPRAGTRCRPTDSCSTLKGKIFLLEQTISSHQGWDWTMGWPRGGGRHSQEIADFWNALARCMQMFEKKCKKDQKQCDKDEGFPEPAPQPTPQPNTPSVMPIPIDPIVPPMPMPEPMPEPIFPLEPVFPF
jgi:RHS repeat-associated protein